MPRKHSRLTNNDDDTLSQYSRAPDSDDREIEVYAKAVAEFKMTWQKQRREKERKFLKAAQAELDEYVDLKKAEIQRIINEMEEMYQKFLLDYATLEDKKREIIVKIIDTQKTLVSLSVRKHQETVEHSQNFEDAQAEGIRQMKEVCQDFRHMVGSFMKV